MNVIQCTCLGKMGRFGNCLFQYAFARAYAEKYGAVLEVPEWIGEKLFGLKDKRPSLKLPKTNIDQVPWGKVNIDLCGHFQHKQFLDILNRKQLKKWFDFIPLYKNMFPKIKEYYIAAHLRRGDYLTKFAKIYCTVSKKSYFMACDKFNLDKSKIVWISEESPQDSKIIIDKDIEFLTDFLFYLMPM